MFDSSGVSIDQHYDKTSRNAQSGTAVAEALQTHTHVEHSELAETLKEQNAGGQFSFWVGTKEEYDSIEEKVQGCFYIITDDTSKGDIIATTLNSMSDYPIESGYKNGWYWEKWNSGKMELWGRFESTTKAPDDASGTTCWYASNLPVTFTGHPVLVVSGLQLKTYSSYIMMAHADAKTIGMYMKCANPINSEYPCYFQARMTGRWK